MKHFKKARLSKMPIALAVIFAVVLIIAAVFCGCGARKYSVDYCGAKDFYANAKDSYKEGEEVELIFELIATDTDYTFFLDGETESLNVSGSPDGFVIRFTMPDHNVKLSYTERNLMEYIS